MASNISELAERVLWTEKYGPIQAYHFTDRVLEMAGVSVAVTDPQYSQYVEDCKRVVEANQPPYYLADLHIPR